VAKAIGGSGDSQLEAAVNELLKGLGNRESGRRR
jgi:hypothetical protein